MRLLLDTHAFVWLMYEPERLSAAVLEACQAEDNRLYLSAAVLWEIQIKHQAGRFDLDVPLAQVVHEQVDEGVFELLDIRARHVLDLDRLPRHHGDPFDRILIAQARTETMHLVSRDTAFKDYSVDVLW